MNNAPPPLSHLDQVQQLFVLNASQLRGFILGFVPELHEADDIFQEVFLTVSHKAMDFQPGSNFMAWVRAIARMKVHESFRQRKSHGISLDPEILDLLAESAPEMDDSWASHREALARCLEQIAPKSRQIIDLRYEEGLRPPCIAQKISWTVEAVHIALTRARHFLRDCVNHKLFLTPETGP